jgi:hypothetical protein
VVIRKGRNEKTFIISDKKEEGVLKGIKKLAITCLAIGGVFFAAGLFMLLQIAGIIGKA